MMKWRIYYDNGYMFDNEMGEPEDAPGYGVVCIVQPDETVGRLIMHRWNFYYWVPSDAQWWGSDIYGVLDRLCHRLEIKSICQGRTVSNVRYKNILMLADNDKDFPHKSGSYGWERAE